MLLFFNLFGILFMVYRKFFFKDTGKKLKHLEKQLDSEDTELITELDRKTAKRTSVHAPFPTRAQVGIRVPVSQTRPRARQGAARFK